MLVSLKHNCLGMDIALASPSPRTRFPISCKLHCISRQRWSQSTPVINVIVSTTILMSSPLLAKTRSVDESIYFLCIYLSLFFSHIVVHLHQNLTMCLNMWWPTLILTQTYLFGGFIETQLVITFNRNFTQTSIITMFFLVFRFGGLNAPLRSGKHTSFEGGVKHHHRQLS